MTRAEREDTILSLRPVVIAVANAKRMSLPVCVHADDIISAGWLGAIQAVDRFDPARGILLTTFAKWRIIGAIRDYLRSLDSVSRDERRRLSANPDEQAPRTFSMSPLSDDGRVFDISDKRSEAPFRRIEARLTVAAIRRASPSIKPRALRIVSRHASGETMKDIGTSEGLGEGRVSQICKATYTELRKAA